MNKQEYQEYLKSDHWKNLKEEKRRKTKVIRCAFCASIDNIDVHHLLYRNIYVIYGSTEDLRFLCRRCHEVAHKLLKTDEILKSKVRNNTSHNSLFQLTKIAVKTHLGILHVNHFNPEKEAAKPKVTKPKSKKVKPIVSEGMKLCLRCVQVKPMESFTWGKKIKPWCKECYSDHHRKRARTMQKKVLKEKN